MTFTIRRLLKDYDFNYIENLQQRYPHRENRTYPSKYDSQ